MNSLSLNEISQNIINILRGGRSSNNEHFSLDQVKFLIKYYRSLLIRRDQERNLNRSALFEQDLGLVSLETVDASEDDTKKSANILKRTVDRIPTPVRLKEKIAITHVGGRDKYGEPLPLIDTVRSYWNRYNKYTSRDTYSFYRDGFIYVENELSMKEINIRGIFEDPEQVFDFAEEDGTKIYDINSPYPISSDMIEQITKAILSPEARIILQTRSDTFTDFQPTQPQADID